MVKNQDDCVKCLVSVIPFKYRKKILQFKMDEKYMPTE